VGDDDAGNLIGSKGFQFTIVPAAFIDTYGYWRPEKVEKPDKAPDGWHPPKATNTWIYAIGYPLGAKAKLVAEYHADDNGALTFLPGDKRRKFEPGDANIKNRTSKPAAGLPTIIQDKAVTYAFVATRGQLAKDTIWAMENSLPRIYSNRLDGEPFNLNDVSIFVQDKSGNLYLPVVDVLSIGEGLNKTYVATRDHALAYVNGKPDGSDAEKAKARRKQYQLAKMIQDQLVYPPGGAADPLHLIYNCLNNRGKDLNDCISVYEKVTGSNEAASNRAAQRVIDFIDSDLWELQHKWYWESKEGRNLGHYWVEAECNALNRFRECAVGREHIDRMVREGSWLVSCLFLPEEPVDPTPEQEAEVEQESADLFDAYTVVRKAGTAVVTAFCELAPSVIVYGKVRAAAKNRVIDSFALIFAHAEVTGRVRSASGEVVRRLHVEFDFLHIEIKWKKAKADLKEWVEQGKPHWREGSTNARVAEHMGYAFMFCEAFNFYSYLTDLVDKMNSQTATEEQKRKALIGAGGALLDLAVACEDPIRAYAKSLDAQRAADRAFGGGAEAAAEGGGEAEAVGLFGKMTAPWVFKAFGAVSAAIDTYYAFWVEAPEADKAGDRALARAKRTVGAGSAVILAASIANGAGYILEAAALTAAASALLVLGVFIVAVGWALTVYFSTTMWQRYVKRSSFGTEHGQSGEEDWSGGDFSTWTNDTRGYELQIQVLTAMMCAFKMSGTAMAAGASDWEAISVEFGALPPGSKLELDFDLKYEAGREYHPKYTLDLETRHCERRDGPGDAPTPTCYPQNGGPVKHVVFGADRPSWAKNTHVKESSCAVVIRYAPQTKQSDAATGIIPMSGPCKFKIYDGIGVDLHEVSSLDYKAPEKPKGAE
jgi:hypothetical protein